MNFSINGTKINTSEEYRSPNLICAGATDEDLEWFEKFSYWIEGIFQLGLGKLIQEKKVGDFRYFGGFHILNTVLIYPF